MKLEEYIKGLEEGLLSPKDLVLESIDKIKSKNKDINAVVNERFDKAIKESEKDYSKTVFKGIPILLKSLGQNHKDEPSTAASVLLKDVKAPMTDNFVSAIEGLGFIILGQTNSPEFGFKNITDPKLFGSARNPEHLDKSPGGSSGGAAAALLAGFTPVVAASDGGGSIRIPASFTGLVGLKPTRGSIPTGPFMHRGWQGASVNFFITNYVEDAELLFNSIKKNTIESPFNYVESQKEIPNKLKVAYTLESPINSEISEDAKEAVIKTVELLKELGHDVECAKPKYDGFKLMEGYYMVNGVETASMIKSIEAMSQHKVECEDIELMSWVLYQYGLSVEGWQMVDALNMWDQVSEIVHDFHNTYDLFITPTNAKPAPYVDQVYHDEAFIERMKNVESDEDKYDVAWTMFEDSLAYTPFTMLANITGQPAISLPMYRTSNNEAMGVQLMAEKGNEKLLFKVSKDLMSKL